ncbi:hypothetical protein [Schnuerera sp.]|uniref:hypothetical protein n=1 Tax=Schnuerera sp. TaxID=2794844 RepID=UPI002BD6DB5F|nr:hypothetical protein [Schnuerera sp.]HSH35234.1 hypothetical protein [Schnuerera sp.]
MIRLNCNYCGRFVWKYKSDIRDAERTYCDRICLGLKRRNGKPLNITLKCLECNKEYTRHRSHKNRSKFCSNSCRMIYNQREQGGFGKRGRKKLYPKTLNLRKKVAARIARRELKDHYIVSVIGSHDNLVKDDIPNSLIKLKRKQIKLKRAIQ